MKTNYLLIATYIFAQINCDDSENKPENVNRNPQAPITIVNISASSLELNQILSALQKFQNPPLQISKENLQTLGTKVTDFIDKYKYWTPVTTVSFIYCCLLYKIMSTNKLMSSENSWCNWKPEIEFNKLLAIPQKDLSVELINAIQKKYSDPQNPTNFVTPMVNFVNDTNEEIKNIQDYVKIAKILKKLKTTYVFPVNDEKINLAQEKINKLTYLKNIFTQWSVDFKQQQLNVNQTNTK